MQFVKPISFQEALDLIGDKSPIGAMLSSSEWSDVPVALRLRAMFSANVENVRFLQRAQDALGDFLDANKVPTPEGAMLATGSRAAFVQQLRELALAEGMGPLDQQAAGGLQDITSERRLGLIFDTLTRQAQDYGYWRQGQDPDVLNEFPAQRFIRVLDVKEPRQSHIQYEDQVYLKTDPIWALRINQDFGVPWGPWGWGCGHDVEDVDREESVSLGLIDESERVEPDVKNFNENLQASTRGLDPDLLAKMKSDFGDQLVINNDGTMSLVGSADESTAQSPESTVADANQNPVSDALKINLAGSMREYAQAGIAAIDKVHDDGALPEIPIERGSVKNALGNFSSVPGGDGTLTAVNIGIAPHGQWPALTTVHEVGHFLDLSAIGKPGYFASAIGDPDMKLVLDAAKKTDAIQGLMKRAKPGQLLQPEEIWARAYAQFIAERSGNRTLLNDLAKVRAYDSLRQWTTEDFKPVAEAIETMFRKLGWI